uniref:Uncharacterized protein n=1 Tax=Glycine max TaxID=3847 RepID=C6SY76_SOYBN|nr:unknown [Glycine max]
MRRAPFFNRFLCHLTEFGCPFSSLFDFFSIIIHQHAYCPLNVLFLHQHTSFLFLSPIHWNFCPNIHTNLLHL